LAPDETIAAFDGHFSIPFHFQKPFVGLRKLKDKAFRRRTPE
jgi:hypothetical protein